MSAPPYLLSRHAFTAVSGERVVILDLLSGGFLMVGGQAARALGGWVQGWPLGSSVGEEPEVLRELTAAGLLTQDRRRGKCDASPVNPIRGTANLADYPRVGELEITFGHVLRFLLSSTVIPLVARFVSLRHIVAYIQRRKRSRPGKPVDLESIAQLVDAFNDLLPWIFTRKDRCYRNSLMLMHFLSQFGVRSEWVFAVRGEPFTSHCWIQIDNIVLNDYVARTAELTPVLTV